MENQPAAASDSPEPIDHEPINSKPTNYEARAALSDVDSARQSLADRLITPWWYHPSLGVIIGAIVLTAALDTPNLVRLPVALAAAVGIGLLVGAYQRLIGLWVDMRNLGPTSRKWWLVYAVVVVIVVGLSLVPTATGDALPWWVATLLAVTAVVNTVALGRRIDSAMREEIRTGVVTMPSRRR